ncbi:hypothetical protein [Petropleomorpha daqingensis]|uniref:Uncharacterized protein n=1 Tax=Petropleomorpha daqingensis TaxID=2026353 RepID=A0A853CF23_9ACTN|nr:hypothetical protein [Petropleomorpha daqingensis]NYJ05751.1 hypothetical protein [Petropleomorpha daqingensis]
MALVLGVLLLVPGLALLVGGGALLWADSTHRTSVAHLTSDATDPGTDLVTGIAAASGIAGYLDGVQCTVVDDLGSGASPGTEAAGGGRSGDQTFWTPRAGGWGTQQLTWRAASGNWALGAMDAGGSPGIRVTSTAGATAPSLAGLGWGLLVVGGLVSLVGVLLIVLAARRKAEH